LHILGKAECVQNDPFRASLVLHCN